MVARRRGRPGIALLAAMLAIALMTILIVDFTTSAGLGYRGAANQADELRAYYLARSGVEVGLAILQQNTIATTPPPNTASTVKPHDSLDQLWAQPTPPIPVDGGTAAVTIVDEDRKVNVNLLFDPRKRQPDPTWMGIAGNVLTNIGLSPDLLPIIIDWLDPDSVESAGGAEADYYLGLTPPYEPRNGPLPTIYDLRMLKGMNDAAFLTLMRYFTAMPISGQGTQINVNTAPPEILAALVPENDPQLAQEIVAARTEQPFNAITDLTNRVPAAAEITNKPPAPVKVSSTYFTLTGEGDFAGARKRIYATFQRGPLQRGGVTFRMASWHED